MAAARLHSHGQSKNRVALSIPNEAIGPHMPSDFVGLSYEVQQLADPSFFSGQNSGLIREFKALSSTGVLRLGGNTSEFAYWKPKPDSPEPEHPQVREVVGEPKAQYYAITPEAVRNLAEHQSRGKTGYCAQGICSVRTTANALAPRLHPRFRSSDDGTRTRGLRRDSTHFARN
jgi:hypothetical protein